MIFKQWILQADQYTNSPAAGEPPSWQQSVFCTLKCISNQARVYTVDDIGAFILSASSEQLVATCGVALDGATFSSPAFYMPLWQRRQKCIFSSCSSSWVGD